MSRVIAIVACGFTLAACSASMSLPSMDFFKSSPQTEALRIESEPPGAEAKTSQGQTCRTPCEVAVQPTPNLSVTVALNGYQPQTVTVLPEGPPTGAQREADTPAQPARLAPNPVYVELQATPPVTPPAKKKKTAAKPKPTTTATVPSTAAQSASAAAAPPPMQADPAPSSASAYPWPSR
jgi:hypothetical protein